jgi:hypothetical protein
MKFLRYRYEKTLSWIPPPLVAIVLAMSLLAGFDSVLIPVCNPAAFAQDLQRGIRNYRDIVAGRKTLEQLSTQEREEVLIIFRRLRSQRAESGRSSDCRDARSRAESAASDLAGYARRLQRCAEGQDFTDDCSSEFRRVRSAYDDYESAVSEVSSYCN